MVWGVVLGGVMKSSLPGVFGGSAFRRFLSPAKNGRTRFVVVLLATMALLASVSGSILFSAYAQTPQAVPHIVITLHKSITLPMSQPYSSAVVGSPEIADAMPMTDRTLYIQGKSIGITNVSIYDENMRLIKVVDVEVALDTTNLQQKIRASTGNTGIHVSNDNQQIVLSGMASDAVAADRAVNIATAWIGSGANGVVNGQGIRVVNAMTISSPQQVMLKVRFLEVSRQASRALGVNWTSVNAQGTRGATLGQGGLTTQPPVLGGNLSPTTTTSTATSTTTSAPTTCPPSGVCAPSGSGILQTVGTLAGATGAPFGVFLAQIVNKGVNIEGLVTALETKGLAQTLAEPNLVALSGDTASFQAGGSIPVPTVQPGSGGSIPTITTQYVPYGVLLNFRPTVLNNGIINLSINPTVSELDYANAVTIAGTAIPALTQRTATTTIELRSGQSFAIAGMLQANNLRNIQQLPYLGDVPVLGALFRSASYQKSETDLVIIVTPEFAQPAAPGARLATPFDNTVPSNDFDFFALGKTELTKKYTDYVSTGGGIQGPYGHMLGVLQGPDAAGVQK